MKHVVAIALGMELLAALSVGRAADAADAEQAPRLECLQPVHDFGERDENDSVEHAFVLRNAGGGRLAISRVWASCGCTVMTLSTNVLPPGAEAALKTVFPLRGRRGEQRKNIEVESNDPAQPRFTLWLQGVVTRDLYLDPAYVGFGSVPGDTAAERRVQLHSRRPGVSILAAESDSASFTAVPAGPEAGWGAAFIVRTVPPLAPGQHAGTIAVATDHPQRQEIKLPLFAFVSAEVRVIPRELVLRGFPGSRLDRQVFLYPGTARDYRVLEVNPPMDGVDVTVVQSTPGVYRIELKGLPIASPLDGKALRILTDLDRMAEIRVPIRVIAE